MTGRAWIWFALAVWAGLATGAAQARGLVAIGGAVDGLAIRVQAESGRAAPEALRMITHTREYCAELSARATEMRRQSAGTNEEARLLALEGDRLCHQGQIRPGIIRLRRALLLLRGQAPTLSEHR